MEYGSFTLNMSILFLLSSSNWLVALPREMFAQDHLWGGVQENNWEDSRLPDQGGKGKNAKIYLKNHPYIRMLYNSEARSSVNWFSKKSWYPPERFSGKSRPWRWRWGRWRDVWSGNASRRNVRGRACSWCPAIKGLSSLWPPNNGK